MAATVTWDVLRDLAAFRAAKGCAISLYLDLDPSESPTPEAVDTRVNALLDGRDDGVIVGFVGRERGDLYRLRAGRLEEIVEQHDEAPGRHDQGGWSQSRYQRHIEKVVQDHLRDVAELLARQVRRLRGARVVLVVSEETRAELEEELSHEVRNALIGWTSADAHAGAPELYEAVEPLVEKWRGGPGGGGGRGGGGAAGRHGRAAARGPPALRRAPG